MTTKKILLFAVLIALVAGLMEMPISMVMGAAGLCSETEYTTYQELPPELSAQITEEGFVPPITIREVHSLPVVLFLGVMGGLIMAYIGKSKRKELWIVLPLLSLVVAFCARTIVALIFRT